MKRIETLLLTFAALTLCLTALAEQPVLIHSHNDYCRRVPFYQAYSQGVASIEVDLFLHKGKLLVGHEQADLTADQNFEVLYVEPLVKIYARNQGRPWSDSENPLQLMIELKSETAPTLAAVVQVLEKYPQIFNPAKNRHAVQIVITGGVPAPEEFAKYPDYVRFDGIWGAPYTPAQLQRVAMFSLNFADYSVWNGKGSIIHPEKVRLEKIIAGIHAAGKPVRFWGAPEGVSVWYTFYNMGIDYINTDRVEACTDFFNDFANKNYQIGARHKHLDGVTGTKRLDKTTRDFKGFQNDKLQLTQGIEIYHPSYLNDGAARPVKNVIMLIGDGMGLAQIVAAEYANKGLTMTQLKYIGLQFNNALDAFSTDSAAAGSTLATGVAHNNRYISISPDSIPYPTLCETFHERGLTCGVVTLGHAVDATPAAFYGHNTERDNAGELTTCLLRGTLDLLCGSGIQEFTKRQDGRDLIGELSKQYNFVRAVEKINDRPGKTICIDEQMEEAAQEQNLGLLAQATRQALTKLQENNDKGFFLMIEGAKIDYAGHSKCLPGSIVETLSFDLAIAEALKFADQNGETLILVTADHETGGLTLLDGDLATGRVMGVFVTDDHTPMALPVFAYGPGADRFTGVYLNTEIARRIKQIMKF